MKDLQQKANKSISLLQSTNCHLHPAKSTTQRQTNNLRSLRSCIDVPNGPHGQAEDDKDRNCM